MKQRLVLYYSKTGNSQFIAGKLAQELTCDSKRIIPLLDSVFILFLLSLLKINIATNISRSDLLKYDELILIGPIWGGLLISPLRIVLKKSIKASKNIHFAVTCESKDEDKNSKYGYNRVLKTASDLAGINLKNVEAFSTSLVNSGNKAWSPKLSEKIKITDENYAGIIKSRLEAFANKIKSA